MIHLGGLFLTKRWFFIRSYNYWNFPNICYMYMYVGTQERLLQRFAFVYYEKGVHGFQSFKQGALPPRAENFGLTHTNTYPQMPKPPKTKSITKTIKKTKKY